VRRIGVKRCLAGSMLTWGVVSVATLATRDTASFYALRFLLGVTEASFFPAVIAYFSVWFPSHRLAKVMAFLFLAMPLGVIVGGPLSGWIMDATHGGFGLRGSLNNLEIGLVSAFPYLVASVAMVANAQHSVRTGERRWHTALPVALGGVALLASLGMRAHPVLAVACLTAGVAGIMSTLAMFWSLPSRILAGEAAAGGAGLVNIGAAVAGFV
ncbi:MFS transporter, partial [Burkholderia cenocepacia]|nr:MFS transporter [Burkholderia cenocepacia]MDR5670840.1 MFS transporter [Burkholderia cenocepacia]